MNPKYSIENCCLKIDRKQNTCVVRSPVYCWRDIQSDNTTSCNANCAAFEMRVSNITTKKCTIKLNCCGRIFEDVILID